MPLEVQNLKHKNCPAVRLVPHRIDRIDVITDASRQWVKCNGQSDALCSHWLVVLPIQTLPKRSPKILKLTQYDLLISLIMNLLVNQHSKGWISQILSYEEVPVDILDRQIYRLQTKDVASVKVLWRNHKGFLVGCTHLGEALLVILNISGCESFDEPAEPKGETISEVESNFVQHKGYRGPALHMKEFNHKIEGYFVSVWLHNVNNDNNNDRISSSNINPVFLFEFPASPILQEFPDGAVKLTKEYLRSLITITEKKDFLVSLQNMLNQRSDLPIEILSEYNKTQLEIFVAIKMDHRSFLSLENHLQATELIEIFSFERYELYDEVTTWLDESYAGQCLIQRLRPGYNWWKLIIWKGILLLFWILVLAMVGGLSQSDICIFLDRGLMVLLGVGMGRIDIGVILNIGIDVGANIIG
ncbi:hypothetical protein T459_08834 [Capsicum annuum]|uniref:Uncharacterized protein n=1 Tax=Capsicum annuum TaxID=4072 RepID=A0A2G2ZXP2_CAPAN|nr:hypothetical protein T459_08834 [Capsicum annuum]